MNLPPVIAHRGARQQAPENTLAAFRRAAELGARWVELDVQLSADGIPVVFHDVTLERCSNGQGRLDAHTLVQLQRLDCGSWFDPRFAGEPLPSLQQVLALLQTLGLGLNLELKAVDGQEGKLVAAVLAVLEQADFDDTQLLISSFSELALRHCQALAPAIRRGMLWERLPADWPQVLARLAAFSCHPNQCHLNHAQAQAVKQAGYRLIVFTANDPRRVETLRQWGVDAIITDCPERFLA